MGSMTKQKITITIEKHLVQWIDEQTKIYRFRNRSHGFEFAVAKLKEKEK